MYKHLYDCFKHWYHGGSIYFYSDTHFNDEKMKEIRNDYIDNEEQVKAINKIVHRNDTIIFLGDIGDTAFIKRINGYKILIMGNHERGASNYKRQVIPNISVIIELLNKKNNVSDMSPNIIVHDTKVDNHLFDEVYEGPLMISDKILLSHEPVDFKYALNIHGHDHSRRTLSNLLDYKKLNVCAEHINYTPISLKSIVKSGLLKAIPNIHRDTIDRATKKNIV